MNQKRGQSAGKLVLGGIKMPKLKLLLTCLFVGFRDQ